MTSRWILCVDDEPEVLEGLELQLGVDHDVRTADGGEAGLDLLRGDPDCAVIVSDMCMPGMNGARFLAAAREVSPDSARMLLAGKSDIGAAISAINEGGIFRFMTKPTRPPVLTAAVEEGIRHWELIRSERVLLEETLHGAAEALIEALEIASPAAFSRSRRMESASRHVADVLGLDDVWQVALAGLLFRLGWVAVPAEIVDEHLAGHELDAAAVSMFEDAFATTVRLIGRIPRLHPVADIITAAQHPSGTLDAATVVRAVSEFDHRCSLGRGAAKALKELENSYPPELLDALESWDGANDDAIQKLVTVHEVIPGMVVEKDIITLTGNVLVRAGTDITGTVVQRLHNFARSQGIREPITVAVRAA